MKKISGIVDGVAIAYFQSYKCLIDKHIEVCNFYGDSYSTYFVPAITTAAFSLNLHLKISNKLNVEKPQEVMI